MTLGDLIDDTNELVEELTAAPVHFTEADVIRAVNSALNEISDGTEFFEQSATLHVRPLATYHDLRDIGQYKWLRLTSIWSETRNIWLRPIDFDDLDRHTTRRWEIVTGEPDRWFMHGLWWLGLYPVTTAEDRVLRLYGKAVHPELSHRTDVILQLPEEYRSALISYSTFDLLSKDAETTTALEQFADYIAEEKTLGVRARGRITRDRIPIMGMAR